MQIKIWIPCTLLAVRNTFTHMTLSTFQCVVDILLMMASNLCNLYFSNYVYHCSLCRGCEYVILSDIPSISAYIQ